MIKHGDTKGTYFLPELWEYKMQNGLSKHIVKK